jgi:cystathionine beta-synthase
VAKRLQQSIPNSVILNQYSNEDNPLAHELTTGPEIIDAIVADYTAHSLNSRKSSGKVDAIVIGAGTGGTITGVSRAIKKVHNPDCHTIGVDPVSPCTPNLEFLNPYPTRMYRRGVYWLSPIHLTRQPMIVFIRWRGSGKSPILWIDSGSDPDFRYDFVPDVLDRHSPTVDKWIKIGDEDALPAAMRLIKEEALLVGGSSGTALAGALQWLKSDDGKEMAQTEGKNVVVILPDG